jgi:hypothetical protein
MVYCQSGQKASLWINGKRSYVFDGSITVSTRSVDRYSVGTLANGAIAANYQAFDSRNRLRWYYNDTVVPLSGATLLPVSIIAFTPYQSSVILGVPVRNYRITVLAGPNDDYALDSQGNKVVNYVTRFYAQIGNPWVAISFIYNGTLTGQKIWFTDINVNGSYISIRDKDNDSIQPTINVKCDDRCPMGERWDPVLKRCVWANADDSGDPIPSDHDNDPNTPKTCPTGYFRFFNRCILLPGWQPPKRKGDPPIPPDWNPFDRYRPPDPQGNCLPGWEAITLSNGKRVCVKKCKPGEYRDPKTRQCCCGDIPRVAHDIRSLTNEVKAINREYRSK